MVVAKKKGRGRPVQFSKMERAEKYRELIRQCEKDGAFTSNNEVEFKELLLRKYGAKTAEMFDIELHNLRNSGMKGFILWKACATKYLSKDFISGMTDGMQAAPFEKNTTNDVGLEQRIDNKKDDFSEYDVKYVKEEDDDIDASVGANSDIEWLFNNIDNYDLKKKDCKNLGLFAYLGRLREDGDLLKDFYRSMWAKVVRDKMDKENKLNDDEGKDLSHRIKSLIHILEKEVYDKKQEFEETKDDFYINAVVIEEQFNKYGV